MATAVVVAFSATASPWQFRHKFTMDDLVERLSHLLRPENAQDLRSYVERRIEREMLSGEQSGNIRMLPSDSARIVETTLRSTDYAEFSKSILDQAMDVRFLPPQILPCANVEVEKFKTCSKPGTMACSECRLVSYCSKDCQIKHWKRHKQDCRNTMRSDSWSPVWEREGRPPSFFVDMGLPEEFLRKRDEKFSTGMTLWGNTPAMDVVNLSCNERDDTKDFSLAFIASGDLRHVLSTVNGLPMTYTGRLSILVNDFNPYISCRNIVLLLILGNIDDEALAVDMAIHFWYSICMPSAYKLRLSMLLAEFLTKTRINGESSVPLGPSSTLSRCLGPEIELFAHFISSSLSVGDVQQEYDRVRNEPSRRDFRDRIYLGLKPSHRVAFEEYRRFGLLLPFGALNAHFNCPNNSLFNLAGKWTQTDYADPLEGWDMKSILAAGQSCGAQPEDIYGCLYFFLSKELRKFVQRIRKFKISFTVSTFDAGHVLPVMIQDGDLADFGIPSSMCFDRISVSNILDENYVGIKQVLTRWAPLLARTPHATIVGYFMNWFVLQPDGRSAHAGDEVTRAVVEKSIEKSLGKPEKYTPTSMSSTMNMVKKMMFVDSGDMEALYDSSGPFEKFLRKRGLDDILRHTKMSLRMKHTIVPHRILAPLRGKPSDLPVFPEDDSWYYNTKLTCFTWSERYVEFTRAS